jgi:3-hydroxybutyryl-CoA dehydrogenase
MTAEGIPAPAGDGVPGSVSGGVPASVAVIGGGRMGAGIAQVFAAKGAAVCIVESDESTAAAAARRVTDGLATAAARGALAQDPAVVAARLTVLTEVAAIPAGTELLIEAVPERTDLKIDVLTRAEQALGPDTILATNTSSLPVTELAAVLLDPARFLGMHFFNPVPPSRLVEVVTAPQTSAAVTERVLGWVAGLGKAGIAVRDSPGFATSRLGVLLGLEAIRMLEEGVATAEAIDTGMELGYRHQMGPLRSTDLVGLDVRLAIAEHLQSKLGDRFAPPQLLRDKVASGDLGRKTGRGFYTWDS